MARIITLASGKGGTGKTTVAFHLAAALAHLDRWVLVIDLDPQGSLTFASQVQAAAKENGTVTDVFTGRKTLEQVIVQRASAPEMPTFDIVPANGRLSDWEFKYDRPAWHSILNHDLARAKEKYDFILIDSAASIGILMINALFASTEVIAPIPPEPMALPGINRIRGIMRNVDRSFHHTIDEFRILLTRYNADRPTTKTTEDLVREKFPDTFRTVIRDSALLPRITGDGVTVFEDFYGRNQAQSFDQLARELMRMGQK